MNEDAHVIKYVVTAIAITVIAVKVPYLLIGLLAIAAVFILFAF